MWLLLHKKILTSLDRVLYLWLWHADSLAGNPGPAGKNDSPSTKSHNLSSESALLPCIHDLARHQSYRAGNHTGQRLWWTRHKKEKHIPYVPAILRGWLLAVDI